MTSTGMILRDRCGNFVATRVSCIPGNMRVEEGEAMGLHEALSWIEDLGYSKVIFETNCKMVVHCLDSGLLEFSEFGELIRRCKSILLTNPLFHVVHIHREANFVAHALTRVSWESFIPHVWVEPPDIVVGLPTYPCSYSE